MKCQVTPVITSLWFVLAAVAWPTEPWRGLCWFKDSAYSYDINENTKHSTTNMTLLDNLIMFNKCSCVSWSLSLVFILHHIGLPWLHLDPWGKKGTNKHTISNRQSVWYENGLCQNTKGNFTINQKSNALIIIHKPPAIALQMSRSQYSPSSEGNLNDAGFLRRKETRC